MESPSLPVLAAWVVHPFSTDGGHGRNRGPDNTDVATSRTHAARLEEAVGLARAINLDICGTSLLPLRTRRPATLLGKGQIEELGTAMEAASAGLLIVDATVTPIQQRNLERALNVKVIDRTGLILEIFGERAHTREGELQVELAHLTYQQSRLVRTWTHLERQRGGFGFLGGPGESQIETDRRLIRNRIARLRQSLDSVRRTRGLQRRQRQRAPYPVVALVGYTNAGKSTLFNRLTGSAVVAADQLFATLDPTLRAIQLGPEKIILSDTVGFVSALPTQLIAAFRSTLEEVTEADIVVHVRDIAHPDTQAQKADVETVLGELGLGPETRIIEAWNKIDCLDQETAAILAAQAARQTNVALISALTGEGIDPLLTLVVAMLGAPRRIRDIDLEMADGASLAWLYRHGDVLEQEARGEGQLHVRARLSDADYNRWLARGTGAA